MKERTKQGNTVENSTLTDETEKTERILKRQTLLLKRQSLFMDECKTVYTGIYG